LQHGAKADMTTRIAYAGNDLIAECDSVGNYFRRMCMRRVLMNRWSAWKALVPTTGARC